MTETKGRYILGGGGSHWEGCEETHWDCRISQLEAENAELRSEIARLKDKMPKCTSCLYFESEPGYHIIGLCDWKEIWLTYDEICTHYRNRMDEQ